MTHKEWQIRMMATTLVLASCITSASSASVFTLESVEGTWSNVIGGGTTVEFIDDVVVTYGNGFEDQVRWGDPVSPNKKSGLGFTGAVPPPMSFDVGDTFEVGQLRHFNYSVYPPAATSLDLTIDLLFTSPVSLSRGFTLTFNVNETENYPQPVDDWIYFPNSFSRGTFAVNGTSYTLEVLGFGSTPSNLIGQFQSAEGSTNSTLLWGKITPIAIPAPGAVLLGGIGLGIVGWLARRRIPWQEPYIQGPERS